MKILFIIIFVLLISCESGEIRPFVSPDSMTTDTTILDSETSYQESFSDSDILIEDNETETETIIAQDDFLEKDSDSDILIEDNENELIDSTPDADIDIIVVEDSTIPEADYETELLPDKDTYQDEFQLLTCGNNNEWCAPKINFSSQGRSDNEFIMFEKNGDKILKDTKTNLYWSPAVTFDKIPDPYTHCKNLFLGGWNDWTVPDLSEIMSLVSWKFPASRNKLFDNTKFIYFSVKEGSGYRDFYYNTDTNEYSIFFEFTSPIEKSVRCVRHNYWFQYDSTSKRFKSNKIDGNQTAMEDTYTGLIWIFDGSIFTNSKYDVALDYCKKYGDSWRLPEMMEILSLYKFTGMGRTNLVLDSRRAMTSTYYHNTYNEKQFYGIQIKTMQNESYPLQMSSYTASSSVGQQQFFVLCVRKF